MNRPVIKLSLLMLLMNFSCQVKAEMFMPKNNEMIVILPPSSVIRHFSGEGIFHESFRYIGFAGKDTYLCKSNPSTIINNICPIQISAYKDMNDQIPNTRISIGGGKIYVIGIKKIGGNNPLFKNLEADYVVASYPYVAKVTSTEKEFKVNKNYINTGVMYTPDKNISFTYKVYFGSVCEKNVWCFQDNTKFSTGDLYNLDKQMAKTVWSFSEN